MGTNISYAEMVEGLQIEPALTVTEEYDSNVVLSSSFESHDFVTVLTPRLTLSYRGLKAESSLSYQAVAEFYRERSELNTVKHIASLSTQYRLSQTTELKIQDQFTFSPDATDIAPTGIIGNRTKQYNNGVSANVSQQLSPLTSAGISYSYAIQRYESSNLVDSTVHGVQLTMSHGFTRTDTLKANAGFRYFSFGGAVSQKVYTLSVGATHRFSETFSLDGSGGANLYQDPNNHYTPSAFFDVGLKKSWKDASADLRYLHDLTVSGGLVSTTVMNQSVVLGIQKTLARRLRTSLSGSYATNKSVSGASLDAVSYSGTVGFDYEITAWLRGQIRYSYFQQNSHGTAGNEFRRHQGFVGLTATLPR